MFSRGGRRRAGRHIKVSPAISRGPRACVGVARDHDRRVDHFGTAYQGAFTARTPWPTPTDQLPQDSDVAAASKSEIQTPIRASWASSYRLRTTNSRWRSRMTRRRAACPARRRAALAHGAYFESTGADAGSPAIARYLETEARPADPVDSSRTSRARRLRTRSSGGAGRSRHDRGVPPQIRGAAAVRARTRAWSAGRYATGARVADDDARAGRGCATRCKAVRRRGVEYEPVGRHATPRAGPRRADRRRRLRGGTTGLSWSGCRAARCWRPAASACRATRSTPA